MGLSCECFNDGDYEFFYDVPSGYTELKTSTRKRCQSCSKLININDICASFPRFREVRTDIEERIFGDFVPLCDKYICERCADIFFSLDELGFCISYSDSMDAMLSEYHASYLKN